MRKCLDSEAFGHLNKVEFVLGRVEIPATLL